MITLGIECSSRQGSVALLKEGDLLAEKSWIAERVRHNTIFQTLEELMAEAHCSYSEISLYAVGRGPGSFSGMRMSFAIAQALALPSKTEVRAVSSGKALALRVAEESGGFSKQQIAIVGDARRGQVWIGFSNVDATPLSRSEREKKNATRASRLRFGEWALVPYEEVEIPEGTLIVSPEAERLTEFFPTIGESRFPHATEVARLALMPSDPEPLEPLYMHPPVFVPPR